MKKRIVRIFDLGPEPNDVSSTSKLLRAYQWYNYEFTSKDGHKFVKEYAKTNFTKSEISVFNNLSDNEIPTGFMWLCRMKSNNLELSNETNRFFNEKKNSLMQKITSNKDVTENVVASIKRPSVQNHIKIKIGYMIAELDGLLDNINSYDINTYEFFKKHDIKAIHANKLLSYYKPIHQELLDAQLGKDEQLKEAYSFLNSIQFKKRIAVYDTLISDIDQMLNNNSVVRKPRKKKFKSAIDITKSMKYMKEFNELKLVSISPDKIIGSSQLWIYNTKYKQIGVFHAKDGGLNIKGTSILNFDEETSKFKRLKKPEMQLKGFTSSGKIALRKFMETIRSKEYKMTSRINEHTILLKIII